MNELDHILDVHRRETQRFEFWIDVITFITMMVVGVIIHACGQ